MGYVVSDFNNSFKKLNAIQLDVKSNQGQKYVPWNTLWAELKKVEPLATFEFHCNSDGVPYFNSKAGVFVKVSVTVGELTHTMTRPVYNKSMKSMCEDGYDYTVKAGTKKVAPVKVDDINDSQMRCLAKAIAMHGLGLYVYEDKQFADAELLDSSQISEISNLISKHDLMLSELLVAFGINKLSELYSSTFEKAVELIENAAKKNISISQYISEIQVK